MEKAERNAFVRAYGNCIAVATEDELNKFLDEYYSTHDANEDVLYEKYPSIYGSIIDALTLWREAVEFASPE